MGFPSDSGPCKVIVSINASRIFVRVRICTMYVHTEAEAFSSFLAIIPCETIVWRKCVLVLVW